MIKKGEIIHFNTISVIPPRIQSIPILSQVLGDVVLIVAII
jgi:hypothetical protein